MKAFITGATGFIGSNLIKRLQGEGWDLVLLVRPQSDSSFLTGEKVKIVRGDLSDTKLLQRAIKGIDIVFNVAAVLPYHKLSKEKYREVNVEGVKNLLRACGGSKIKRFVQVSSVGIYGPPSIYAETKLKGEQLVMASFKKEKLPVTIVRPTTGYGPRDTRPVILSLYRLIKKRMFVPIGNGKNFFHTVYIDNLVDALILSATRKEAVGEDFIIGDEPCPTMGEITDMMGKILDVKIPSFFIPIPVALLAGICFDIVQRIGLPAPLTTQRVKFMTENQKYNVDKAKKLLGWKPKIDLYLGLKRTYDWYRKESLI